MDPIGTTVALGAAGVAGTSEYWGYYQLSNTAAGGTQYRARDSAVDVDGNIYALDWWLGDGVLTVTKLNLYGELQWRAQYDSPTATTVGGSDGANIVLLSSTQFLIAGYYQGSNSIAGTGYDHCQIIANTSDGSVASSNLVGSTTQSWSTQGPYIRDTSGNYYSFTFESTYGVLIKLNSSLTPQFARTTTGVARGNIDAVATDGTNIFAGGGWEFQTYRSEPMIEKLNSSGTRLAYVHHSNNAGTSFSIGRGVKSLTVDSSGNVYAYIELNAGRYLVKYNNSLTLQWQKKWSGSFSPLPAMVTDSSGNLYIASGAGDIAKIDSSGTIVWQRDLNIINLGGSGYLISSAGYLKHDGSGALIFRARSGGSGHVFTFKLPDDGSGIGTYDFFTYGLNYYSLATTTDLVASSYGNSSSTTSITSKAGDITSGSSTNSDSEAIDYIF